MEDLLLSRATARVPLKDTRRRVNNMVDHRHNRVMANSKVTHRKVHLKASTAHLRNKVVLRNRAAGIPVSLSTVRPRQAGTRFGGE